MHEPFLIALVKRHLWEFIMGAICLTMIHTALDNYHEALGSKSKWVNLTKAIVNGIYASVFFGGLLGYFYNEIGLVAGIILGGIVGLSSAKEIAIAIVQKIISKP